MKNKCFVILFSLVSGMAFCGGIGEWAENGMYGDSIGDAYIRRMENNDSRYRFLQLVDNYISRGEQPDVASMKALNDYDPSLAEQVYQDIWRSDRSRRDLNNDVGYILMVAGTKILEHFRPPAEYAYVNSDVNIRSGPSIDTSIVTVLHKKDKVEVLDKNPINASGWVKIKNANGHEGYIRKGYLQ
jgi:uncharacterized protein YgiM (DUF1202 family)